MDNRSDGTCRVFLDFLTEDFIDNQRGMTAFSDTLGFELENVARCATIDYISPPRTMPDYQEPVDGRGRSAGRSVVDF